MSGRSDEHIAEALAAVVEPLSPADRDNLVLAKVLLMSEHLAAAMLPLLNATSEFIAIAALRSGDIMEAADRVDDLWRALGRLVDIAHAGDEVIRIPGIPGDADEPCG